MKHNLDTTLDRSRPTFPKFPRFRPGQYVTVGVPRGTVWINGVTLAKFACGDMFRVIRSYRDSCLVMRLRCLTYYEIDTADLVKW